MAIRYHQAQQHRQELQQQMLGIARLSAAWIDDPIGGINQVPGVLSAVVGPRIPKELAI